MSKEMFDVQLTNDELVFLFGQLHMRELAFKEAIENHMKEEDYDSVTDCTSFVRKIKSLKMKLDDARLIANIGSTSID